MSERDRAARAWQAWRRLGHELAARLVSARNRGVELDDVDRLRRRRAAAVERANLAFDRYLASR